MNLIQKIHCRVPRPCLPCRSLVSAVGLVFVMDGAAAQTAEDIPGVVDQFHETCGAVLASPDAFYRDAIASGQSGMVTVATTEDKRVHVVADLSRMPNIGFFVEIGEIAGHTTVACTAEIYVDPSRSSLEGNIEAFLAVFETLDRVAVIGGTLEGGGLLIVHPDHPEAMAQYVIADWLGENQEVFASIQKKRIQIATVKLLPQPFTADD